MEGVWQDDRQRQRKFLSFKGEDVHPNLRIDGSWFDFQFVGLSKSGDVLDRSDKITEMVKYTFDCP
jgi:hypothetical protein